MKWREVVDKFIEHSSAVGSNCFSTGEKLFSYETCIAQWLRGTLYINKTKYSPTTSKLQNYLYNTYKHKVFFVGDTNSNPYGIKSLI